MMQAICDSKTSFTQPNGGAMQTEIRQVLVGWMRQFGSVTAVYVAALATATWALTSVRAGPLRTAVILAPILPGLALIWLTVRAYGRCDEFIRLRILQAAALAAIVVAVFSLVYFFFELLGLPHLSAAWISNVIWAVFVVQMLRLIVMGK
jgi:hypothetical protein